MPSIHAVGSSIKTATRLLDRQVNLYSLAAVSAGVTLAAIGQTCEAEVVYTPAHKTIGAHLSVPVDFNHDGVPDLTIRQTVDTSSSGIEHFEVLQAVPTLGGGIETKGVIGWAAALPEGAEIGSKRPFFARPALMIGYSSAFYGTSGVGYWTGGVVDRFLGVKFSINGEIHYGWARVKADLYYPRIVATLEGYAYETEANTSILAGDKGKGMKPAKQSDRNFTTPASIGKARTSPASGIISGSYGPSLGMLALGADAIPSWRRTADKLPVSQSPDSGPAPGSRSAAP